MSTVHQFDIIISAYNSTHKTPQECQMYINLILNWYCTSLPITAQTALYSDVNCTSVWYWIWYCTLYNIKFNIRLMYPWPQTPPISNRYQFSKLRYCMVANCRWSHPAVCGIIQYFVYYWCSVGCVTMPREPCVKLNPIYHRRINATNQAAFNLKI